MDSEMETVNDDVDNLYINCDQNASESDIVISQLSKKTDSVSAEKEKLKARLSTILTPTKLEVVRKILESLSPALNAAEKAKDIEFFEATNTTSKKPAHNSKVAVQRRLFSTKKKQKKNINSLKRPTTQRPSKLRLRF